MTARTPAIRFAPIALAALVAAAFFAASASGRSAEVVFMSGQHRIVKGNEATVTVGVLPKGSRCSLSVRYKGGTRQRGLDPITAPDGIAKWTWTVPRTVKTGPARVTASCGSAGRASRTLTVIGGVIPANIRVVKSGWSLRPLPFVGTSVSYGVILANDSPQQDAQDVTVLVNFVMADNRLIGSATVHVSDIQAGSEHATGGDLTFPGAAPIARLEFVVQIGKRGPATHDKPGVSSVRVTPSIFEPTWCGGVEGEIQNDHPTKTVQQVELSTVVLDADGNILGGGTGFSLASLPPSTREFFKISQGVGPINFAKAASALVSVVPTYK